MSNTNDYIELTHSPCRWITSAEISDLQ